MKKFKVALVGCGAISGNHINGILAAGQTLCALCDIVPEHAEARKAEFKLNETAIYTDYREMLDREKPDIVHIATPHYLHAPMIIEALNRGINVLSEKPLSISIEQLRAVLEAEKKSKGKLGVCQQNRYEPNMIRLKKLIDEKGIRVAAGTVIWERNEAYYRSGAWRGTIMEEGGGTMINQALHTLDILQWLCGMPTHVTAHIANDYHKGIIEVEDTADATFELPDGKRFHFYATTAATGDLPVQFQLVTADGKPIIATNQLLAYENELLSENANDAGTGPIGKQVWGMGHTTLIADFYRCVAENKPFGIPGTEAAKVIRLILSMYNSHGNRIKILS